MSDVDAPSWLDVTAVTGALETVVIQTLQQPDVKAEIRTAVRPAVIEAAAVMGITLAVVLFAARRF